MLMPSLPPDLAAPPPVSCGQSHNKAQSAEIRGQRCEGALHSAHEIGKSRWSRMACLVSEFCIIWAVHQTLLQLTTQD